PASCSSRFATVVTGGILSRARGSAAGTLRDEGGDVADLGGGERVAEGRHRAPAALDLHAHLLEAGAQRVEIRADVAGALRGGERVAAAAPGTGVDACPGGGVGAGGDRRRLRRRRRPRVEPQRARRPDADERREEKRPGGGKDGPRK